MWFAKVIKNLKWWDLSLIKAAIFFFSLFVASYISSYVLIRGRWLWLVLAAAFAVRPVNIALKHM